MAGHSKWANIQHRKGRQDARRGKIFTRMAKMIILAAKQGGGDPDANSALRLAIQKAKAANLPNDKIETAIKKGTGELEGGEITETYYEGYGQGGVALLIETATDNKNRTVAEVRHMLSKYGGSMGEAGSVAWMFDKKGVLTFDSSKYSEDDVLEVGLEAGADDVTVEDDVIEVHTDPQSFSDVQAAFEAAGMEFERAEISMIPKNMIEVDMDSGRKLLNLLEKLEDLDDVQNVHLNADFPDELMTEMED